MYEEVKMKIVFVILMLYSFPSFGWSLIDKLKYDNYKSCLDHKLIEVDKTKTDMNTARSALGEDCKKTFCTAIYKADDEYESCLADKQKCNEYAQSHIFKFGCYVPSECYQYKYKDETCPGYPEQ